MAALSQPENNSDRVTSSPGTENELFMPKETPDQRCDVILVVKDGKEFKAHKQVLSEASPFFEKLLKQRHGGVQRRNCSFGDVFRVCYEKYTAIYLYG